MKQGMVIVSVNKSDMAGKKGGATVKVSVDVISIGADIEGDATNAPSNELRGLDQCFRRSKRLVSSTWGNPTLRKTLPEGKSQLKSKLILARE
jgi:hypothetical protein